MKQTIDMLVSVKNWALIIVVVLLAAMSNASVANEPYNLCVRCGNMEFNAARETASQKEKSVQKCRELAERGLSSAQLALGIRCANGWGVEKNYIEAKKWFRRAAAQEDDKEETIKAVRDSLGSREGFATSREVAYYNLAVMSSNGWGCKPDKTMAVMQFRIAAHYGLKEAQLVVGDLYANGDGVDKDEKIALEWYRKAAEQGDKNAQRKIGALESRHRKVAE